MKILVIGSKGQLGSELMRLGATAGIAMAGRDLPEMDITDNAQVAETLAAEKPGVLINAAAFTDVEKAQTLCDAAFSVNSHGPAILAEQCAKAGAPLIHISTDFVFDGQKNSPYLESDATGPLSVYGASKLAGEKKIMARHKTHLIFRTSWLYGVYGANFVKTMLGLAQTKKTVRVVADQHGSPTCAADLARALISISLDVMAKPADIEWGIYHYGGLGATTWAAFATQIYETAKRIGVASKIPDVIPIPASEYPTAAKRPLYSVLDCAKIKKNFGISPRPWPESLEETLKRLLHEKTQEETTKKENQTRETTQ